MNAWQRWNARAKEQGRLFRLMPLPVQEAFLRQEWRLTWWSWLTVAVPVLAMSFIMVVAMLAMVVFLGVVYDPADPDSSFAAVAEIAPAAMKEGLSLVVMGPLYALLWAMPASLMPLYARRKWVERWHRDHETGEVPPVAPPSPIVTRLKAWWRALPAE